LRLLVVYLDDILLWALPVDYEVDAFVTCEGANCRVETTSTTTASVNGLDAATK
jgi:hypothetical protein